MYGSLPPASRNPCTRPLTLVGGGLVVRLVWMFFVRLAVVGRRSIVPVAGRRVLQLLQGADRSSRSRARRGQVPLQRPLSFRRENRRHLQGLHCRQEAIYCAGLLEHFLEARRGHRVPEGFFERR